MKKKKKHNDLINNLMLVITFVNYKWEILIETYR